MSYVVNWNDLPEVEILPNNFRKSAAGLQCGVNRIRIVHPSATPRHQHEDSEQTVLMLKGRMYIHIDNQRHEVSPGDICVLPIGTPHSFETIEGEVELIEIFAPMRIQNLIGFVGKVF
ncbi:Cupin domain-containing protein [Mesorhizobium sp. J18]|uniref:cupin domain-containing protein n=1 Tax=Mesorhizobium sp. J18 TaxID=935263 RepID=UPI00119AF310|nr:cupin domain-containing protein [Mesorhizobium sp. J18]TWG97313.1 Cupin domain-containing protein [Mesorhizobium sp. J18]